MTTSVTATLQLDLAEAVTANPAGPLLVLLAAAVLAGPARRLVVRPLVVYLLLASMWAWELHRFDVV